LPIISTLQRIINHERPNQAVFGTDTHDSKTPSPTLYLATVLCLLIAFLAQFRPSIRKKTKKAALRLVQSAINSFTISIISQKSRRKNEQKRAKMALNRPQMAHF
jgi:hypothetical protein